MRNFGFTAPDVVVDLGTNGKMPEICAAMGLVNLRSLNEFVTSARRNYETYAAELDRSVGLELLRFDGHEVSNFQYAVVEAHGLGARGRDYLLQALAAEGVMARKYFWPGCDRAAPYREHGDARLENTRAVADRVLVLPNGSHVSPEATATISHILNVAAESSRSILP
jgi:dTDP-4-amino-4,6-dideoxygalactose transaminase